MHPATPVCPYSFRASGCSREWRINRTLVTTTIACRKALRGVSRIMTPAFAPGAVFWRLATRAAISNLQATPARNSDRPVRGLASASVAIGAGVRDAADAPTTRLPSAPGVSRTPDQMGWVGAQLGHSRGIARQTLMARHANAMLRAHALRNDRLGTHFLHIGATPVASSAANLLLHLLRQP